MNISNILSSIDIGGIALPEFQRGYVWNREQVRGLMHSLYRKYPVGSLLVWVTRAESEQTRGSSHAATEVIRLLLDGQQRITSLYGIIRGKSPQFFEGNAQSFTGLYFHLGDEIFEFYAPLKMKDNPLWINVTELMKAGVAPSISRLLASPGIDHSQLNIYISRLNAIDNIKQFNLHIEEVAGEDKTIDVVVDIFNRVNSGGTTLSKGDLALAKIGAHWPQARQEMNIRLQKWSDAGFSFRLEWLLRCINTVLTGNALFSALGDVKTYQVQRALPQTEQLIDTLLEIIVSRLGLDNDHVLGSRYSFPLLARYLDQRGGALVNAQERDRLLFWYIHTFLWGRYAGSTESVLNQDLSVLQASDNALEDLIRQLRKNRGDLRLNASDFGGWGRNNRFYPLLYMLTRVDHARDWASGVDVARIVTRPLLHPHYIFPKEQLYAHQYSRGEVNAIANFAFITADTWPLVTRRGPSEYLEEIAQRHPGVLESHWIPVDRSLWQVENYRAFKNARQELLAAAANTFLDSLREGRLPEPARPTGIRPSAQIEAGERTIRGDDEEEITQLRLCNAWIKQQGLPEGEMMYEITDVQTQEPLVLDLAWPSGIQEGYSRPVALLLGETSDIEEAVQRTGYRVFTGLAPFYRYVEHELLRLTEE